MELSVHRKSIWPDDTAVAIKLVGAPSGAGGGGVGVGVGVDVGVGVGVGEGGGPIE